MKMRTRAALRGPELLESRLAPASLVVFTDPNGDLVKFSSSVGNLNGKVTYFLADLVHNVYDVDIREGGFNGANLTVSVTKSKSGDGRAIVGHINAGSDFFGYDLGIVKIAGDLGEIDAGSHSTKILAIKSLTVDSFGRFGQFGDGSGRSQIEGNMGSLVVKHDFNGANFYVKGNLASASVGGSVVGGYGDSTGQIFATGNLGKVSIKHDIRGGDFFRSAFIGAGLTIASVTVGGSVYGGLGGSSGSIGGALFDDGRINKVTIGGSIVGGAGALSGAIGTQEIGGTPYNVSVGTIAIGKDIVGGSGAMSGAVATGNGSLDRLTVGGSLIGGSANQAGFIGIGGHAGTISILGNIYGGSQTETAKIFVVAGIDALTIGGSIYGGSAFGSGYVQVPSGGLGKLKVRGDVFGGRGTNSGAINVGGSGITTKLIGGAVIPGIGVDSGTVMG